MAAEIEYRDPAVDWETRAYWEGCKRGELVLQRCSACDVVQHPPRAQCTSCLSGTIEHFVASGHAKLHTYTITLQNHAPGFREACPYVLAYVELEEGPMLLTNIIACELEDIRIDMALVVDFVDTGEFAVPRFRPR